MNPLSGIHSSFLTIRILSLSSTCNDTKSGLKRRMMSVSARFDVICGAAGRGGNDAFDLEKLAVREQVALATQLKIADAESQKKKAAAEARVTAAKQRLDQLKQKQQTTTATSTSSNESFALFVQKVADLRGQVSLRKAVFDRLASYTAADLQYAFLDEALPLLQQFNTFENEVNASASLLEQEGQRYAASGADFSGLSDVKTSLAELHKSWQQVVSPVSRESARRRDYNESVAEFLRNQSKLVQWCRQQRSALESLKDPEQIQEYSTSFQNNVTVMETNFLVLMELSEPLVPNVAVEDALREVTDVWLHLEIFAYEKLRTTLLDLHQESGLQTEAKMWAEFAVPFKKFLGDAQRLLQMPTDDESRSLTQPVLEFCNALLGEHDAHSTIVEHLSDFSVREDCLKDHYAAIRRSVFSKLTLLTQSFHAVHNYPRKQEYTDRLAELTDWVECKSQGNAWKQLLSRVAKMRQLIEENEAIHGTAEDRQL